MLELGKRYAGDEPPAMKVRSRNENV
jgi:hypothetical protein